MKKMNLMTLKLLHNMSFCIMLKLEKITKNFMPVLLRRVELHLRKCESFDDKKIERIKT